MTDENTKPIRSAALLMPDFASRFERIEALLSDVSDQIHDFEPLAVSSREWQEHIEYWRFSPEELIADLVCAAARPKIRRYVEEHPDGAKGCFPDGGGVLRITEQWADEFWTWLHAQPSAARILRAGRVYVTCFLRETVDEQHNALVREHVIEWISQRKHERTRVNERLTKTVGMRTRDVGCVHCDDDDDDERDEYDEPEGGWIHELEDKDEPA